MKKLILLFFLICLFLNAFQSSNKVITDTLDMYARWGIIRMIDTTNDDTTYLTPTHLKAFYADLDSATIDDINATYADIDTFTDDVHFDSTLTSDGGYIANAIAQAFVANYNISAQLGSYVHGIKVEHTRTADIQPASSGWFGGQFVLNSGTTAWDDINVSAYAVQGLIKGDQWDGVHDVNAGRFELQSSGSVRDIVYILANSGTSVSSSMLYMPTHISLPNMIQFNAQSNSTVTNGIDFVSGAGSQFKYGIDFSGATIDSADIRFSDGSYIHGGYGHFDDSLATPKLKADFIAPNDSGSTTFIDDVVIDSTLIVNDSIKAKDSGGLAITDDAGNLGIFIEDSTGWVGIGTTNPTTAVNAEQIIHIVGDNPRIEIEAIGGNKAAGFVLRDPDGSQVWQFSTDGSGAPFIIRDHTGGKNVVQVEIGCSAYLLYLDGTADRVGINTSTPNAKLDVVGGILADSLKIGGGDWITKIVKIGSYAAILFGTDTFWLAADTSSF